MLPDELLLQVFSKLDARELCRARRVCKSWSRVAGTADLFEYIQPVEWSKGEWGDLGMGCGKGGGVGGRA